MVQRMTDSKFNENGPAKIPTGLPNCDQQQSLNKMALRDSQKDNRSVMPRSPGNLPFLKNRGSITETSRLSGIKRSTPECPQSPPCYQSPGGSGANGPLVYIRRKFEQELAMDNNAGMGKNADCPQQKQAAPRQKTQNEGPKDYPLSAFTPIRKPPLVTTSSTGPSFPQVVEPPNDLRPAEPDHLTNTLIVSHPVNSQSTSDQYWKERYLRLQTQLRNCDNSSQEDYIKMLRSLSSAGRSKHAVELEKRAIQLLLEEGHELQRMKVLNVLGKALPKESESSSAQNLQDMSCKG